MCRWHIQPVSWRFERCVVRCVPGRHGEPNPRRLQPFGVRKLRTWQLCRLERHRSLFHVLAWDILGRRRDNLYRLQGRALVLVRH